MREDVNGIYGTGIFNYIEDCVFCKKMRDVDINGMCEECYKEYIKIKELKGGNNNNGKEKIKSTK